MREGASSEILSGSALWAPTLSSWLGFSVLADTIPIESGKITVDVGQQVQERLTFEVPAVAGGYSWVPGDDPTHPLARFGQYIDVTVTVTSTLTGEQFDTRLGRFQVQSWDHDDQAGTVSVECVGLLQRVSDAKFRAPQVPRANGTLASEFARLMPDGIGVNISGLLEDRAVPQSFTWDQDRLGALYDIVDAWPARLRVDEFGICQVLPPLSDSPGSPVVTLTDGLRGTVVGAPTADDRDGVANVVVARSSNTDDPNRPPVWDFAAITAGPMSVFGPYGEVVDFYSSPLLISKAHCQRAAAAIVARAQRAARQRVVRCAPDPRIELDDSVAVVTGATIRKGYRTVRLSGGGTRQDVVDIADTTNANTDIGWVVGYDLPLTADGGPMTVRVGVPS